jgi:hypothetical protein
MKLGLVNMAKFAAVVASMVIATSVNAWATCPTSPNYSPDFSVNGISCLAINPSANILAPVDSAASITGWTSSGTGPTATVTFATTSNSFVAGEPVILSGFTTSPFFNTLVFPVQSPVSGSFTVTFAVPSGHTSGTEAAAVATPLTVLQLTPDAINLAGSAWDTTPQPVGSSFSTTFYFQLAPGASAGDGFAFVIQDSATTALGDGGCGLGFGDDGDYASCAPDTGGIPNSLAVVFKTSSSYASPGFYPAANSVSIQTNHASPNCVDTGCNLPGAENDLTYTNAPTLADGNIHSVTITSTTQPTHTQTGCAAAPGNPVCLDVILDGTDLFPLGVSFAMKTIGVTTPASTAWVGFTGATSTSFDVTSHSEANNILSWVFTPAGASTTGNVTTTSQTNFNFQGGYTKGNTTGYNFNAQLTSGNTVSAVVTSIPISSQAACNALVRANSLFSGAECFVYQNAGGPGIDQPVMFELTCPPAGVCDSGAGTFPATLGSEFPFLTTDDGSNDNLSLTLSDFPSDPLSPAWTPAMTTALNGGYPGVGLLKGQGPDPIHPCTPFSGINPPPLFQSNQISAFVLDPDTSGGAKASSGNTNSCWVVTYLTPNELPTVSITAPSSVTPYSVGSNAVAAQVSCSAINDSNVNSGDFGPYLSVSQCTYPSTFDTSVAGSFTYTAFVTDSALNTNYQTVNYTVQSPPVFGVTPTEYFTVGVNGPSFEITTTGYPPPSLSAGGLPTGLSLTDNHNGTASIGGTPNPGTGGSYTVGITATNPAGSPTENITVVVDQATAFAPTSPTTATFTPGTPGSVTVSTTGYPTATFSLAAAPPTTSVPSWLTLTDNHNGTATISGTPPPGMAASSFSLTITATNSAFPGSPVQQPFTLNVGAGTQSVSFTTIPAGLSYTVNGVTYSSGTSVSLTIGQSYNISTTSPQGSGGTQYQFLSWSDGLGQSHSITVTTTTLSYTANFNTLYQLTTAATTGGTVLPASGGYYAATTVVPISATATAGYTFTSWSGSPAGIANSTSASTTVTMGAAPESVTATFTASTPTLGISPTSLNFGSVNNNTFKTLPVTLTNNGATTIKISSITIPGSKTETSGAPDADDYSFLSLCGSSILPGKSCTIFVTFSADNDYLTPYASLVITDNANLSPQSVGLTGSVLDPLISLSPSSLSFGTVTPPATATKTITVKNSGLTNLILNAPSISGTDFALTTGTCSTTGTTTLVPGALGTCTISVTFSPPTTTKNTNYSGTVTITSNALNGATEKISLSGTGK